jgi:toxin ParE1/3/4
MSARIRPRAQQDILELAERFGEIYPKTGAAFLDRVDETIDFIAHFPGVGSEAPAPDIIDPAIRFFPIRSFRNFLVAYVPVPEGVEVIRVIDGRRDLGEVDFSD